MKYRFAALITLVALLLVPMAASADEYDDTIAIFKKAGESAAFFVREGNNIRLTLPITLGEAVQGAKVKVPTPEGPVMMTIPKGSTSGKLLRLKGRGFTAKDGHRGDLLVQLAVDVPHNDEALQKFVEGWDGGGNPRASLGV